MNKTLKMMRPCMLVLLLCCFGIICCWIKPANANDRLGLNLDVAQFRDKNKESYLEIYYAIPQALVQYTSNQEDLYSCNLVFDIEIEIEGKLWANKAWSVVQTVGDPATIDSSLQFVDVLRYFIDTAGLYTIRMRVKDMGDAGKVDSSRISFAATSYLSDHVQVSSLEFASSIERASSSKAGNFVKGYYEVVPIPVNVFGRDAAQIFFYFEGYNLNKSIGKALYKVYLNVLNGDGKKIKDVGFSRRRRKHGDTSIEMGTLELSKFSTGKYFAMYGIADSSGNLLGEGRKEFYIYNPEVAPVALQEDLESVGPLNRLLEREIDTEFEVMKYLVTREEKLIFQQLDNVAGKRKYLHFLWHKTRQEYSVSGWLLRDEYLARVAFTEQNYNSLYEPGWRSDRGRIFILYGAPSHIERFPSTQELMPYQKWTYEYLQGQSNIIFVFVDKRGFGRLEMIHSTLRGEIQDYNWEQTINRGTNENFFR